MLGETTTTAAVAPVVPGQAHSETDMSNPEEKREVSIANKILKAVSGMPESDPAKLIKSMATELKNMHTVVKDKQ